MSEEREQTTIGLSEGAHQKLQMLKRDGFFAEMTDAYRFAVALAMAHGMIAATVAGSRATIFNVGTLDPDRELYHAIRALRDKSDEPVYRTIERLAEWGVEELSRRAETNSLVVANLLRDAELMLDGENLDARR